MNLKKVIFALFCASFIGIMANPEMLAASNSVAVKELNPARIVETLLPANNAFAASNEILGIVEPLATHNDLDWSIHSYEKPVEYYSTEEDAGYGAADDAASTGYYITIAGRDLWIEDATTANRNVDSGDHIVHMAGTKWYRGHNSWDVLRGIYNMGQGSSFTITENGVTRSYVVAREPVIMSNMGTYFLHNGLIYSESDFMRGFYQEDYDTLGYAGATYDVVISTCYGEMISDNDAAERFVLFARAV